ncbi:MAG: HDOD domain-containing protein [Pseudomonadota bacterium]
MSTDLIVRFAALSFTLPDTCVRIRSLLDDPATSSEDIAKVMSVDPSLSAKVLKLANSALFRFQSEVGTVKKALQVIGGEAAYNISIAETANLAFKSFSSKHLNFDEFWHRAVLNGVIAKSIAQQRQVRGSDRYFVIGILHSLSELICASQLPQQYSDYKVECKDSVPFAAQQDIFGFTFAECSGDILKTWKLPETVYQPLAAFKLTAHSLSYFEQAVIFLTTAMVHLDTAESLLDHEEIPSVIFDTIGLKQDDYVIIYEYARAEAEKIAQALN